MAISRRLRYEILRRDNHTCRYCGAKPPEVTLTVDHVTPVALGGRDEPENLVAACHDCNGGKSSVPPDAELVADVAADALRWARARRSVIESWRRTQEALAADLEAFAAAWDGWEARTGDTSQRVPRESGWEDSVERWLDAGLTVDDLIGLIPKAMHNKPQRNGEPISLENRWRYFCGVVWRTLEDLDRDTKRALDAATAETDEVGGESPYDAGYSKGYDEGFDDGRHYERWHTRPPERSTVPPPAPEQRLCVECDTNEQHGTTGLCLPCWTVQLEGV